MLNLPPLLDLPIWILSIVVYPITTNLRISPIIEMMVMMYILTAYPYLFNPWHGLGGKWTSITFRSFSPFDIGKCPLQIRNHRNIHGFFWEVVSTSRVATDNFQFFPYLHVKYWGWLEVQVEDWTCPVAAGMSIDIDMSDISPLRHHGSWVRPLQMAHLSQWRRN